MDRHTEWKRKTVENTSTLGKNERYGWRYTVVYAHARSQTGQRARDVLPIQMLCDVENRVRKDGVL